MDTVDLGALLPPVDPDDPAPPFEQLRSRIAALVAAGTLRPGARLPTVRALAGEVGLAVNTVARVYRELESDGVVLTEGRRGTSVAASPGGASAEAGAAAQAFVAALRPLGVELPEAQRLVETAWKRSAGR